MSRPKPIPTVRRDRAPGVAVCLILLFTAATAAALVLDEFFKWSQK